MLILFENRRLELLCPVAFLWISGGVHLFQAVYILNISNFIIVNDRFKVLELIGLLSELFLILGLPFFELLHLFKIALIQGIGFVFLKTFILKKLEIELGRRRELLI